MTAYNLQGGFNAFPLALGAPGSHMIRITNNGPAMAFPSFRPVPINPGAWYNELQGASGLDVNQSITQPVQADASGNYVLVCGTTGNTGSITVEVVS